MATSAKIIFEGAKNAFLSGKTLPKKFRIQQLKGLLQMYDECETEIVEALKADMRKTKLEATLLEKEFMRSDLNNIIRNYDKYLGNERLPFNWIAFRDQGFIKRDPLGVCLIVGPSNYPFCLNFLPLHGAIACGNAVIVKPSELNLYTSQTIARIVPKYLDKECYKVFEGGVDETKELLKNKFDYIFATGSTQVGRPIYQEAAENFTGCSLELGGKSPVYIDDSCDAHRAAKRILWGKCINLGQTCMAPDYVLCSKQVERIFVQTFSEVLVEWYGLEVQKSPFLSRIINEGQFLRLKSILDRTKGNIILGGHSDKADLWISPTLVTDVKDSDSTMEGEIFGPILPFVTCNSSDDAIKFINARPKPLSLYVFSNEKAVLDKFLDNVSSGDVCFNDTIWHMVWEGLPFGGIKESGMKNYLGWYSIDTFSHKKGVLIREGNEILGENRYPPYTQRKMDNFALFLRYFHKFNFMKSWTIRSLNFLYQIIAGFTGAAVLHAYISY